MTKRTKHCRNSFGSIRGRSSKGTGGTGKVVADLMFGTWVLLLSKGGRSALGRRIDYESNLWRPALRFCFATGSTTATGRVRRPTRDSVHTRAANLQRLRNRSAHHEPIFDGIRPPGTGAGVALIPLNVVWSETVELLRWIAPALAEIHEANQALPKVLASRPV